MSLIIVCFGRILCVDFGIKDKALWKCRDLGGQGFRLGCDQLTEGVVISTMRAESIVLDDDSPGAQICEPDKVEVLDVALLDMPVKETSDIGSPKSVLTANLRDNSGEVASKPGVQSFTVDSINNVNGSDNVDTMMSTSTSEELPSCVNIMNRDREMERSCQSGWHRFLRCFSRAHQNFIATHIITHKLECDSVENSSRSLVEFDQA